MTSEVEICNRSLSYIRATNINSLNDQTVNAGQCKMFYPLSRDQVLAVTDWGFLRAQKTLSLRTDTVVGWEYVYDYPNDCTKIQKLFSSDAPDLTTGLPYEIMYVNGNSVIVCNYPNIVINYTREITDVNLLPVFVQAAISHLLVSEIVVAIVGVEKGNALLNTHLQLYNRIINKAMAEDANQQFTVVPESDYIKVRNSGNSTEEFYRG